MALQLHANFQGSLSICSMLGKNSKISFFAATESLCWYVSLNPGNLRTSGFLHSAKLF